MRIIFLLLIGVFLHHDLVATAGRAHFYARKAFKVVRIGTGEVVSMPCPDVLRLIGPALPKYIEILPWVETVGFFPPQSLDEVEALGFPSAERRLFCPEGTGLNFAAMFGCVEILNPHCLPLGPITVRNGVRVKLGDLDQPRLRIVASGGSIVYAESVVVPDFELRMSGESQFHAQTGWVGGLTGSVEERAFAVLNRHVNVDEVCVKVGPDATFYAPSAPHPDEDGARA